MKFFSKQGMYALNKTQHKIWWEKGRTSSCVEKGLYYLLSSFKVRLGGECNDSTVCWGSLITPFLPSSVSSPQFTQNLVYNLFLLLNKNHRKPWDTWEICNSLICSVIPTAYPAAIFSMKGASSYWGILSPPQTRLVCMGKIEPIFGVSWIYDAPISKARFCLV